MTFFKTRLFLINALHNQIFPVLWSYSDTIGKSEIVLKQVFCFCFVIFILANNEFDTINLLSLIVLIIFNQIFGTRFVRFRTSFKFPELEITSKDHHDTGCNISKNLGVEVFLRYLFSACYSVLAILFVVKATASSPVYLFDSLSWINVRMKCNNPPRYFCKK